MGPVQKLVKMLSRMFYEVEHFIFLDLLILEGILSEDRIADRLHLQIKQVNKIAIKLREDKFLQSDARLEIRDYDGKSITRTYWYIDYPGLVEGTRRRLKKMSAKVEEMIQKGAKGDSQTFICKNCKKIFNLLDFNRYFQPF
jgi:transcription initiation factor TFIIE subunit alpha